MSVLFHIRRGRAVLGATIVLALVTLASTAVARPATDPAPAPDSRALAVAKAQEAYYASYGDAEPIVRADTAASSSTSHPSWLGFALAAGGALLIGVAAGCASTVIVRRTRPAGFAG